MKVTYQLLEYIIYLVVVLHHEPFKVTKYQISNFFFINTKYNNYENFTILIPAPIHAIK